MPDQFGGIPVDEPKTDQFGGVPVDDWQPASGPQNGEQDDWQPVGPSFADRINQISQATQLVHMITNPAKELGVALHYGTEAVGGAIESASPALKTAQQQGQ
jgi:hypothetical protein